MSAMTEQDKALVVGGLIAIIELVAMWFEYHADNPGVALGIAHGLIALIVLAVVWRG